MIEEQDEVNRLILNGDFSVAGVSDRLPSLVQHLARMAEGSSNCLNAARPWEIDLREIQALDGCGCQLLATFLRSLRRGGVAMFSLKLSQEHREKIHLFGFDNEFFAEVWA